MSHTYHAQILTLIGCSVAFVMIFVGYALRFQADLRAAPHVICHSRPFSDF